MKRAREDEGMSSRKGMKRTWKGKGKEEEERRGTRERKMTNKREGERHMWMDYALCIYTYAHALCICIGTCIEQEECNKERGKYNLIYSYPHHLPT